MKIIGQKILLQTIEREIQEEAFPQFSLFVGPEGSGKKLVMQEVAKMLPATVYKLSDIKVDSIRKMISDAYKTTTLTFYIIPDGEEMSLAAKNAILKLVEEPPKNSYFLMSVNDENQILYTIRSRARIYKLDPYTRSEKEEAWNRLNVSYNKKFIDICDNISDVYKLSKIDTDAFLELVNTTIDSIATISGANALKLSQNLSLKDEDDKYDLKLFFQGIIVELWDRYKEAKNYDRIKCYLNLVIRTYHILDDFRIKGINKQMLIDEWIFTARKTLAEEN